MPFLPNEASQLLDFQVGAVEPTLRPNGDALRDDDIWIDTSANPPTMNIYQSGAYVVVGSQSLSEFQIVSSQTPIDYVTTSDGTEFVYSSGAPV